MPLQALAAAATLLTVTPHGNRIELKLDQGSAEIQWLSPAAFRFRRVLDGELPPRETPARDPVAVQIDDGADSIRLRTRLIEVAIAKKGVTVTVRSAAGAELMRDAEAHRGEAGISWERTAPAGADFYGLGPRNDAAFSLIGKSLDAETPFLVTTAGYGEYHAGAGSYQFDFTTPGKYKITGAEIDWYFYHGNTPKEIFEEHHAVWRAPPWTVATNGAASWSALRTAVTRILQGAMSAANQPMFDLTPYNSAPDELKTRARQLGSIVGRVTPGAVGLSGLRQQLETFYGTYNAELQDRGFPLWHPLPFQFPGDPEAARHIDEFLLGDEMLIAPIVEAGDERRVYLPRGSWTNLETNEATQGPRTIAVKTKSLPVFAKNGSIIPLNYAQAAVLHYFPNNGGEFFLLEPDIAEYTQAHAAPALDFLRLEIESKKDRDYQWVVHHVAKPASVEFDGKRYRQVQKSADMAGGAWFYDGQNLQVRAAVKAGEDCIINVNF
jgi:hypothetical protein